MAQTRNPMQGRHAVGGKTARPGSIRGGQAEPQGNRPITASRTAMRPRPPVLANQAETSRDLQNRLRGQATQPFTNLGGAATLPAPSNPNFSKAQTAGLPAKGIYGTSKGGYNVSEHSIHSGTETTADMFAAVGEPRKPSGYNSIMSGNPTRNNQRQAGRPGNVNKGTSAKENSRMRQTGY